MTAIVEAGFAHALLDPWHGYHAVGQFLIGIKILDAAAHAVGWAMHLYKRSLTDASASQLRDAFVRFVLAGCLAKPVLWDIEQARQLIDYFDARWHLMPLIRHAWTDARVLALDDDLVVSTGALEGSHRW